MQERVFRAMNTDVRVAVVGSADGAGDLLDRAEQQFGVHERILSRFDPASELSALNRRGSRWTVVSPLLFDALTKAAALSTRTLGLYNPAILPALEAAGYDRSFERLVAPAPERRLHAAHPSPAVDQAAIPAPAQPYALRPRTRAVRLAPGVRLDLGGIGKGLAVDAAAARLAGVPGFLVDAGGDIRAGGLSPEGGLWGIAVQDPAALDRDLAMLALTDCAVATSSVTRRRWLTEGAVQHHLIDPRTGRSATSDAVAATVVAAACASAEVWAKAAVIAGVERGFELLARAGLAGLIVGADGQVQVNPRLQRVLATTGS